jgi:hypothetical protein
MELDDALKYSFLQFDPAPRRGEPHVTRRYNRFSDLCFFPTVFTSKVKPQSTYFPRDETGLVCLPTQPERTLQLYW